MGAVTKGLIGGLLAATKPMGTSRHGGEDHRLKAGGRMGAVAKGLLRAQPTAAPGIFLSCL